MLAYEGSFFSTSHLVSSRIHHTFFFKKRKTSMPDTCFHEATGCMTYYTVMPIIFCHTIVNAALWTARIARSLSASSASAKAIRSSSSSPQSALNHPASTRSSTCSADIILEQQLAQLEAEKAQRRWSQSRPPSYQLHDKVDGPPQLPPLDFGFNEKIFDVSVSPKKRVTITIRPVEEEDPLEDMSQPQVAERMSYVRALDESGVRGAVNSAPPAISAY